MSQKHTDGKLEQLETDLLLEALLRYYGYDFRDYEPGAVRRRIREAMLSGRVSTIVYSLAILLGFLRLARRNRSTNCPTKTTTRNWTARAVFIRNMVQL